MGKIRTENKKINKKSNIIKIQKKEKMNGKEIKHKKKPKIVETETNNNKKVALDVTPTISKRKLNKSKEVQNIKRKISSPYIGKSKKKKLRKELKLLMAEAEIPIENIETTPVSKKRKKPIESIPSSKKKSKKEPEPVNSPGRYVRVKHEKEESDISSESGSETYIDKFFSDSEYETADTGEYETADNGEGSSSDESELSDSQVAEMFQDVFHSGEEEQEEEEDEEESEQEEEESEHEHDEEFENLLNMIQNVKDMEDSDSEYSFDAENDVAEEISSNDDTYDDSDEFNPILRNSFEEIDSFSDESLDEEEEDESWDDDDDDFDSDHEIHRRSPRVFDCDDNSNSFNSEDDDGPRIVEVSEAEAARIMSTQSLNDSDDSCPELVPIETDTKCPIELGTNCEKEDDDEVHLMDMIYSATETPVPGVKKPKAQSFQPKPIMEEIKNVKFYPGVNSQVLVLLKDRIYLHGAVKLRLLAGNVEVLGYKIKTNETKEIFSPRGHSLLLIETKPRKTDSEKLNLDEFKDDFVNFELDEIQTNFDKSSSLFLLENLSSNQQVRSIGACMKESVFPSLKSNNVDRSFHKAEFILNCLFYSDPAKAFKTNPEWNKIVLKPESKLVLIGGKSVGKSTLVRFLINKNLEEHKKILLIDLDIGQAEIFVPFTVSATIIETPILGPGFLTPKQPVKSFFFGDVNIIAAPIKYLKCVLKLIEFCRTECNGIPWIINTMGYNKGFGLELVASIIKVLSPTDLIQIQSGRFADNFETNLTSDFVNRFKFNIFANEMISTQKCDFRLIEIKSVANKHEETGEWDMVPADLRLMNILSHLGGSLTGGLTEAVPYETEVDNIHVFGSEGEIEEKYKFPVLNGNLVFLCCRKSVEDIHECFGIGIVRSIDDKSKSIQLLTSVDVSILEKCDSLGLGNIALPATIILNQASKIELGGKIIPFCYNTNSGNIGNKKVIEMSYRPGMHLNNKEK